MSWSILKAGKGSEVKEQVREFVEKQNTQQPNPQHVAALNGINDIVRAFADAAPEATLLVESNGHIDQYGGNCTLSIRRPY